MKYLFALILVTFGLPALAQINLEIEKDSASSQPALIAIPDSRGFVNDRARTFTSEEIKKIKVYMRSQKMDSTKITVLTVNTLNPFNSLEELATQYANMWELGGKNNDGVILVFSKELKKSRVQVGQTLASKFTPEVLKSIDSVMIPQFVKNDYYTGTINALKQIARQLESK